MMIYVYRGMFASHWVVDSVLVGSFRSALWKVNEVSDQVYLFDFRKL